MQKLILSGNVGKNAELRRTGDGEPVLGFTLAIPNGKDKPPTWYEVSVFGKRGESLSPHIKKGDKLSLIGRPAVRVHDGKAYLGINVDDLTFMGGAARGDGPSVGTEPPRQSMNDDMDDEIPF
jgi:single-strand DNA-binding protein